MTLPDADTPDAADVVYVLRALGLSGGELAEILGCTRQAVHRWRRGGKLEGAYRLIVRGVAAELRGLSEPARWARREALRRVWWRRKRLGWMVLFQAFLGQDPARDALEESAGGRQLTTLRGD